MLEAALSVSPPQEHGRLFDLLSDRLTVAKSGRWLFFDAHAAGVEKLAAFRADFASLARQRLGVVGSTDRLIDSFVQRAVDSGQLEIVTAAGEPGLALLEGGWSDPEGSGVWSDGTEALLRLPITANATWRIALHAQPYPAGTAKRLITARVGDQVVAVHEYQLSGSGAPEPLEFTVHDNRPVVLEMPWAMSPHDLGSGGDSRRLGICLHRIVIERIASDGPCPGAGLGSETHPHRYRPHTTASAGGGRTGD